MRQHLLAAWCLSLALMAAHPCLAQDANPEDELLEDPAIPTAPAQPGTPTQPPQPETPAQPVQPTQPAAPAQPATPAQPTQPVAPTAPAGTGEIVTIPRAELDALKAQQAETQRQLEELRALIRQNNTPGASTPSGVPGNEPTEPAEVFGSPTGAGEASGAEGASGGNRNLLLPDISLNLQAKGAYNSDLRDEDRRRASLSEAEIAFQGFVYPNVRAEAYIVAEPGEDVPFGLEQGFLDFLGIKKGLNIRVGRDFTPFGRTGRQHTHSWLYARQLIPISNIVASEELGGDGVSFSYLLPTRGKLYANATLGAYNGLQPGEISSAPFGEELGRGTGAGFYDRFYLARLLLAHPMGRDGELELGGSYARGRSSLSDDTGTELGRGRVDLAGLDVSYRKFFEGDRRLLLRSEYFRNTPGGGLPTRRASGYYGLANLRVNKFDDVGLLYENSGFPQAPGAREKALSLILTRQFTEQFYIRLHATRGDRPGVGSYNQAFLQFTFGLGPHTHNLE